MALFTGKKPLKSTSAKAERRQLLPWKIAAAAALMLVPFAGAVLLVHLPRFRIDTVNLAGNVVVADSDVQSYIQEKISGKYAWLFPRDNIVIYPRSGLEKGIAEKFKRFETVKVQAVNAKTIAVEVTERKPAYLWCGAEAPADAAGEASHCYFIDNIGYIFAEAPYFSGSVYTIFYGPLATSSAGALGQQFMLEDRFASTTRALATLERLGLEPSAVEVLASDIPASPDYQVTLSGGGTLAFRSADSDRIESIMLSILAAPVFVSTSPTGIGRKIDYVDARYGDKVVYKLKGKVVLLRVASTTSVQ